MELNNDEIRRYSRHLILPEVGLAGQKKIKAASVLCIGAGGLGSPITMYLAAAGIGKIGIVDFDTVDFSNLQRQILHTDADVGRSKAESAKETIRGINPHCEVVIHNTRISSENALDLIRPYDIVVDGTDNFPTRYLTNDACVLLKKPNVYGSIFRFEGQASVFAPHLGGPCYRCLYPEPPPPGMVPSCAEGGVLGVLPGIIGCIQATEILKLAIGKGTSLVGRLVLFNALDLKFRGDMLGHSLLFIGYGFGDINVRVIWTRLSNLMSSVPRDDRPPSFVVRLSPDPVLEALDHAVGLTTLTLDPLSLARTHKDRQHVLEQFMVDLTFANQGDPVLSATASPICSPALIQRAIEVVKSEPREAHFRPSPVLEAVQSREFRDFARPALDELLAAFARRKPAGVFSDYRKAIAFNYAMSYESSTKENHR